MATDASSAIMRAEAPCKGCQERTVEPTNCHSVCLKYFMYKIKRAEEVATKNKQRKEREEIDSYVTRKRKQLKKYIR